MGKAKKIGIGIGIVIGVFVVLGIIGSTLRSNLETQESTMTNGQGTAIPDVSTDDQEEQPSTSPGTVTSDQITSGNSSSPLTETDIETVENGPKEPESEVPSASMPLADVLPTREEIGTKWLVLEQKSNPDEFGYMGEIAYNVTDFQEVVYQRYMTPNPTEEFEIAIYRFDASSEASAFHSDLISKIKERGGYEEYSSAGVDADCYVTDSAEHRLLEFYCIKSASFFHLDASRSSNMDREEFEDDANLFAGLVAGRI